MATKLGIWNRALSLAGTKSRVASDTERTKQRDVCDLWWDQVRQTVLGAAFWPSARRHAYLALVTERDTSASWAAGDPAPGYLYSYAAPNDLLRPRFFSDYSVFDVSWDATNSKQIFSTNTQDPILEYSFDQTQIIQWDPNLVNAITYNLAAVICDDLVGKENKVRRLFQQADQYTLDARVSFANTANSHQDTVPDWIAVRGYGDSAPQAQYFYPYSPLLSSAYIGGALSA